MRLILHLLTMAAIALAVGFGLSTYAVVDGRHLGAFNHGAWETWPNAGSPEPDPYTAAWLAREAALQLGQGEGIRFTATHDGSGRRLTRDCSYRVAGETPVATFWTLRATTADGSNVAAENAPLAMHSQRLARAQDGTAVINVGTGLLPGNWLHIAGDGPFRLVLTFYDASFFGGVGSGVSTLPAITRESCT